MAASSRAFLLAVDAAMLLIIFLMTPLLALLGLGLGLVVSSRSTDPRSAQQIAAVVILPLAVLLAGQLQGLVRLTPSVLLVAAVVLAAVDLAVFRLGRIVFERETILTRWS